MTRGFAARVDGWWRRTDACEYLDDPAVDETMRVDILRTLDKMNDLLGSYNVFFQRMRPLMPSGRAARVLELAAGHGGFALAVAALARQTDFDIELTATDIKEEYLALGRARAASLGLSVNFSVQDALDLSNIQTDVYDLVVCTQSLHHFQPGQVALMFSEAARVARYGVIFIDGARSALNAAMIASLSLLVYRHGPFVHDMLVSFRRFFVPEELELLARLGPWGSTASAVWTPPGHCVVELSKTTADTAADYSARPCELP
jgi:ubiquinone/menaquinone biosynthesis C-methylase UbiE